MFKAQIFIEQNRIPGFNDDIVIPGFAFNQFRAGFVAETEPWFALFACGISIILFACAIAYTSKCIR